MRRLTSILIILVAALAAAATVVATEGDVKRPRAVPTDPIKDFEVVAKGDTLIHEFGIKNEGSAALEVTDVHPACGCTVVEFERVIAPGEIGKIKAEVKTDNFDGPINKSIAVFTNDPENPKLQLVVRANVRPYINVLPGYARYNYVQGETVGAIAQTLWAEDGDEVAIVSVEAPYDHLKVTYREATEDELHPKGKGRQWHLEFTLDSKSSPIGALRDHVEIRLDHHKQRFVRIPISGFVRPRQHITPQEVDFGKLEGASLPMRRTLHFTNFITDTIELTEVETGIEGLSVEVKGSTSELDAGRRFQLILTVGPGMPKGDFSSTVKIHTTDEQNPIVQLPIKGTIL